jgi:hypothetical protein
MTFFGLEQRFPGALSLGVKRPGREADHSPPSSAEVKECVVLYLHSLNTRSWLGTQLKHRDSFISTLGTRPLSQNLDIRHHNVTFLKVKVKLSLCLSKYHSMKMCLGVEVQLHAFLTSELDGDEWSASRPGRFNPPRKEPLIPIGQEAGWAPEQI